MDFRLKVFCSVANNLSFTKASNELSISQPAISRHIHELELQYNTSLFERTGSRVKLTAAGELLLSHAQSLLAAFRRLDFEMNLLTNKISGELKIGASTTISQYVLPPLLASFIGKFPDVKVSLLNGNSDEIERALLQGDITLGLVEGGYRNSALSYHLFMKDELVVVASTKGKCAKYDEITLRELRELPIVIRENGSGTLHVLQKSLAERNIKLTEMNVLLQLGSTESIKLFLENSDALGIVSIRAVTRELLSGALKIIDVEDFVVERDFQFVTLRGSGGGIEANFMRYIQQYG